MLGHSTHEHEVKSKELDWLHLGLGWGWVWGPFIQEWTYLTLLICVSGVTVISYRIERRETFGMQALGKLYKSDTKRKRFLLIPSLKTSSVLHFEAMERQVQSHLGKGGGAVSSQLSLEFHHFLQQVSLLLLSCSLYTPFRSPKWNWQSLPANALNISFPLFKNQPELLTPCVICVTYWYLFQTQYKVWKPEAVGDEGVYTCVGDGDLVRRNSENETFQAGEKQEAEEGWKTSMSEVGTL